MATGEDGDDHRGVVGHRRGGGSATPRLRVWIVVAGARRIERMASLAAAGVDVVALDVTDDDSMTSVVDAASSTGMAASTCW